MLEKPTYATTHQAQHRGFLLAAALGCCVGFRRTAALHSAVSALLPMLAAILIVSVVKVWQHSNVTLRSNMTAENTTIILGVPIPSTDPVFLAIVAIHFAFGLAAVITGVAAMLSTKGRGRHSKWGVTYCWCLSGVFVTMSALSFMRWAENYHLFILGALSLAAACLGRIAARWQRWQWPRVHLTGMGTSYVVMLTAFYVDNGKNLPLWKELPQIAFWILPSLMGVPLILRALLRHPLVLTYDQLHKRSER